MILYCLKDSTTKKPLNLQYNMIFVLTYKSSSLRPTATFRTRSFQTKALDTMTLIKWLHRPLWIPWLHNKVCAVEEILVNQLGLHMFFIGLLREVIYPCWQCWQVERLDWQHVLFFLKTVSRQQYVVSIRFFFWKQEEVDNVLLKVQVQEDHSTLTFRTP